MMDDAAKQHRFRCWQKYYGKIKVLFVPLSADEAVIVDAWESQGWEHVHDETFKNNHIDYRYVERPVGGGGRILLFRMVNEGVSAA